MDITFLGFIVVAAICIASAAYALLRHLQGEDEAVYLPCEVLSYHNFRRDCRDCLEGEMTIDDVIEKWSGQLPPRF